MSTTPPKEVNKTLSRPLHGLQVTAGRLKIIISVEVTIPNPEVPSQPAPKRKAAEMP
jgi:hypothetical protein